MSNVFVCNFPEVVCNLNRDCEIREGKNFAPKGFFLLRCVDNNEAKCLFIKTKKKTLEKPTARFVVRGGRGLGPAASQSSL